MNLCATPYICHTPVSSAVSLFFHMYIHSHSVFNIQKDKQDLHHLATLLFEVHCRVVSYEEQNEFRVSNVDLTDSGASALRDRFQT